MVNEEILARLKEFIDNKGWSQAEFARRMGIRAQHVKRYLTGISDIQGLVIKLYEQGCDINWLLSGIKHEAPPAVDKQANYDTESLIARIEKLEKAQRAGCVEAGMVEPSVVYVAAGTKTKGKKVQV